MTDLGEAARAVDNRETLAAFVNRMADDFRDNPEEWENITVYSFLEAMSAWLADSDDQQFSLSGASQGNPTWQSFAEILMAARIYE